MFIALVVLSLSGLKAETPNRPAGKLECLNPVRVNPKTDTPDEVGTEKCLAIPDKTAKPKGKPSWK